ncbi:uncharacterized protein GJ701_002149 isoform 2-T2 [Geothlypis trichas]
MKRRCHIFIQTHFIDPKEKLSFEKRNDITLSRSSPVYWERLTARSRSPFAFSSAPADWAYVRACDGTKPEGKERKRSSDEKISAFLNTTRRGNQMELLLHILPHWTQNPSGKATFIFQTRKQTQGCAATCQTSAKNLVAKGTRSCG